MKKTTKTTNATRGRSAAIVVGIDYTSAGDAALTQAIEMAELRNARLHVVHGLDTELVRTSAGNVKKLETAIDKGVAKLETYLAKARRNGTPDMVGHVRVAAPAEAIVQLAVDVDADLVVVGTTPRKGIAKLVHSSVSGKVLKHAKCPVLLVRKKNHAGMAKAPRIEPSCPRCLAVRSASDSTTWWCERHAERAAREPHVYGYHRQLSLRSEVPPGGT